MTAGFRRRARLLVAVVLTVLAGLSIGAQPPAVITGRVTDAETGAPIRGARISAINPLARTGADGTFTAPMPGRVGGLRVSKPGYVHEQIDARALVTGILDVRMRRGGVLVAYVIDEAGRPVPRANVTASCQRSAGSRATDDLGEARVAGLAPGRCTVRTSRAQAHVTVTVGGPVSQADLLRASAAVRAQLQERARQRAEQARQQTSIPLDVEVRAGRETVIAIVEMSATPQVSIAPLFIPGAPVVSGTARVQGRVTQANGQPAANVLVQMSGPAGNKVALTNDAGAYQFTSLPAGRFQLGVSPLVQLTGLIPAAPAGVIELADGQALTADFRVRRASILSGVVLDEFGDPAEDVMVRVTPVRPARDAAATVPMVPVQSMRTDDRGRYRAVLSPGTYRVAAVIDAVGQQEEPIYFPGTVNVADATEVDVLPESETSGIDIRTARPPGVALRGVVVNAAGQPVDRGLAMLHEKSGTAPVPTRAQVPLVAGTFEFPSVRDGEYDVLVSALPAPYLILTHRNGQPVNATAPPATEFASTSVRIEGEPIAIALQTGPPSVLRGRVNIEGDDAGLEPSIVEFRPLEVPGSVQPAGVTEDWTFGMMELFTATRIGARLPPGWWLRSFTVNGVDAATQAVDFSGGRQSSDTVTAVIARTSRLSGRVTNLTGGRANGLVAAFPVDVTLRFAQSPFVRAAPIAAEGTYLLNLPPGLYYVTAVTSLGAPNAALPMRLNPPNAALQRLLSANDITTTQLESASVVVYVGELADVTQDLRLVQLP